MAVAGGSLWVGVFDVSGVARVSPSARRLLGTTEVKSGGVCGDLAATPGEVWVAGGGCAVGITAINAASGKRLAGLAETHEIAGVSFGFGWLWYSTLNASLIGRIDPATNNEAAPISVPGTPTSMAVGFGSVWIANPGISAVLRLTPTRH